MVPQPNRHRRDQHPTERGECLGDPQPTGTLFFILKHLRKPGNRSDKFHAHTDKRRAPEENEHFQRSAVGRSKRRQRIKKNTRSHDRFPSQTIDQPASEQTKNAPAQSCDPEEFPHPLTHRRVVRRNAQKFRNRRNSNQRGHQQFISIEQKSDAGADDDQPLRASQRWNGAGVAGCTHEKYIGCCNGNRNAGTNV